MYGHANDLKNFINECEYCNKYKRANVNELLLYHDLIENPFLETFENHSDITALIKD